jgi:hypothetical protein
MLFRVDEYAPCSNIKTKNISPNKNGEFALLKKKKTYCSKPDTRAIYLDTIGEEDLFKNYDNFWSMLTKEIAGYPRPSNSYQYVLSYMPYPMWTFECRASEKYKISEARKFLILDREKKNDLNIIITTVISVFFVSIVFTTVEIRRKLNRKRDLAKIYSLY